MRTINLLSSQIATLTAEIAAYEAHRDGSYEDAEAAEAAGDAEATARHDAWLGRFETILKSLRASLYMLQADYNSALAEQEAA